MLQILGCSCTFVEGSEHNTLLLPRISAHNYSVVDRFKFQGRPSAACSVTPAGIGIP